MIKFRTILSSLISVCLLVLFYLIFVQDITINYSYLGPVAEYPHKWASSILFGSMVLALAGSMTLYFTFFEFQKDDDGKLRFSNPNSFLLRFVLKDKLAKPISSCSLFWHVAAGCVLFLLAIVLMPIYLASFVGYIRNEGWSLHSFVVLSIYTWLTIIILNEFFGKSKFASKLLSNSWLQRQRQRMGLAFLAVILITIIISNPMALVYALSVFLGMAAMIFVSIWLSVKSSNSSLFRNHLLSKKEGYCPMIYPKDNGSNDTKQAVR